jgi:hypothetical protein
VKKWLHQKGPPHVRPWASLSREDKTRRIRGYYSPVACSPVTPSPLGVSPVVHSPVASPVAAASPVTPSPVVRSPVTPSPEASLSPWMSLDSLGLQAPDASEVDPTAAALIDQTFSMSDIDSPPVRQPLSRTLRRMWIPTGPRAPYDFLSDDDESSWTYDPDLPPLVADGSHTPSELSSIDEFPSFLDRGTPVRLPQQSAVGIHTPSDCDSPSGSCMDPSAPLSPLASVSGQFTHSSEGDSVDTFASAHSHQATVNTPSPTDAPRPTSTHSSEGDSVDTFASAHSHQATDDIPSTTCAPRPTSTPSPVTLPAAPVLTTTSPWKKLGMAAVCFGAFAAAGLAADYIKSWFGC